MQFDNQKTRNVADVVAKILAGKSAQQEPKMLEEELKGNQHKIDANKNKKIDAHDFKLLRAQKEKEKANSMKFGKDVKEETELEESHFKVGDKVKCKTSGMKGEVVKLDKEDGDEDDKYYTVKREDGTMKKMAPEDMTKINEASEKEEGQFHKKLDTLVHKTFGKRKEEMKEENIDEAMFPGTKEYEKKYGQSPQQKLKKVGDTEKTAQGEMKKTAKGVMHTRRFSEMLETYKEGGLKTIAEMLVKEEPDNEEFTKEVEEVKKKASEKKSPEDEARVAKGSVQAVKNEETEIAVVNADAANGVEMIDIEERSLTEPEMKKREEYVKGMKKKMPGFKERYGERAKEVMYATAAKMAKKD
jgi:hypothetical protein